MGRDVKTPQIENLGAAFPVVVPEVLPVSSGRDALFAQAVKRFTGKVAGNIWRNDTKQTYVSQLREWVRWCRDNHVDVTCPAKLDVERHLEGLGATRRVSTVKTRLAAIRCFYDVAVELGLLEQNPAKGKIKTPPDRSAAGEIFKCLSAGEMERLFESIPHDHKLKNLRDRAIVALMALEGLRRVEICRANVDDIDETDTGVRILVHGKGKDGYIYPREDTAACVRDYLVQRGPTVADKDGEPLFVGVTRCDRPMKRMARITLSKLLDRLLLVAGIAKKGRGCHALRHTCGSQLYQATRDVKVVQETLRHSSIAMAAKYSHVQERGKARYTQQIPIKP